MSYASRIAVALANYGDWKPELSGDRAFNLGAVMGMDHPDRGLARDLKLRSEARELMTATIIAQTVTQQNTLLSMASKLATGAGILLSCVLGFYAAKKIPTAAGKSLGVAAGFCGSMFSGFAGARAVTKYEQREKLGNEYTGAADQLAKDVKVRYRLLSKMEEGNDASVLETETLERISSFLRTYEPTLDYMLTPVRHEALYKLTKHLAVLLVSLEQQPHPMSSRMADEGMGIYTPRRPESKNFTRSVVSAKTE